MNLRFVCLSLLILVNNLCFGQYYFKEFGFKNFASAVRNFPFQKITRYHIDSTKMNKRSKVEEIFLDSLGNIVHAINYEGKFEDRYTFNGKDMTSQTTSFSSGTIYKHFLIYDKNNNLINITSICNNDTIKRVSFTTKRNKMTEMIEDDILSKMITRTCFHYKKNNMVREEVFTNSNKTIFKYIYDKNLLVSVFKDKKKVYNLTYYSNGLLRDIIRYKPGIEDRYEFKTSFFYDDKGRITYEIRMIKEINKDEFNKNYFFYINSEI